jgi:hypothetical protein
MLHFFSILTPARRDATGKQKPFFSDETQLSRAESDAVLLSGKAPLQPDHRLDDQLDDRDESYRLTRFVSLLSPPYF